MIPTLKHRCYSNVTPPQARGFFRGLGFPLASYGIVNSVFFGVYGNTLRYLKGSEPGRKPRHSEAFLAGCVGGFFQLFVACPVDVVKVVLQSQIKKGPGKIGAGIYDTGKPEIEGEPLPSILYLRIFAVNNSILHHVHIKHACVCMVCVQQNLS